MVGTCAYLGNYFLEPLKASLQRFHSPIRTRTRTRCLGGSKPGADGARRARALCLLRDEPGAVDLCNARLFEQLKVFLSVRHE